MIPTSAYGEIPTRGAKVPTRVLVVDSEALVRWSVCTALAAIGFDPVAAADATEARRLAAEWPPPKVAILDLRYPETERDVLLHIRGVYPDCRFLIMTTAWLGIEDPNRTDCARVIEKPFDLGHLVDTVSSLAADPNTQRRCI